MPADDLVTMGRLVTDWDVIPATVTTMVKALAESGLVRYTPYVGARLNPRKGGHDRSAQAPLIQLFLVSDGHELDGSTR